MAFSTRDFRRRTWHFADHAEAFKQAGMTTDEAVGWANHGFTPAEAAPWRAAGYGPDQAAFHANDFRSVAEALTVDMPGGV